MLLAPSRNHLPAPWFPQPLLTGLFISTVTPTTGLGISSFPASSGTSFVNFPFIYTVWYLQVFPLDLPSRHMGFFGCRLLLERGFTNPKPEPPLLSSAFVRTAFLPLTASESQGGSHLHQPQPQPKTTRFHTLPEAPATHPPPACLPFISAGLQPLVTHRAIFLTVKSHQILPLRKFFFSVVLLQVEDKT